MDELHQGHVVSPSPQKPPAKRKKLHDNRVRHSGQQLCSMPSTELVVLPQGGLDVCDIREFQMDALLRQCAQCPHTEWRLHKDILQSIKTSIIIKKYVERGIDIGVIGKNAYCPPAFFIKGASSVTGLFSFLKAKFGCKQKEIQGSISNYSGYGDLLIHYCDNKNLIEHARSLDGVDLSCAPVTMDGMPTYLMPLQKTSKHDKSPFAISLVKMLQEEDQTWSEYVENCGFVYDTLSNIDGGTLAMMSSAVDPASSIFLELNTAKHNGTQATKPWWDISEVVHIAWTDAVEKSNMKPEFVLFVLVGEPNNFYKRMGYITECGQGTSWSRSYTYYNCPFLLREDDSDYGDPDKVRDSLQFENRVMNDYWKYWWKRRSDDGSTDDSKSSQLDTMMKQCHESHCRMFVQQMDNWMDQYHPLKHLAEDIDFDDSDDED